MNQEACVALSAVFPIVMLTVAVERRTVSTAISRKEWFRHLSVVAVAGSFAGLLLVLVGIQMNGLDNPVLALTGWALAIVSVSALATVLIAVMATAEAAEDREDGPATTS